MLELLVMLNQSLYCGMFIPQVIKNFQIKSGKSLSDLYLIAMLNAYICFTFYFFCLNLPLGYKISVLFQLFATVVLILQRFFYDTRSKLIELIGIYLVNCVVVVFCVPYAYTNTLWVGNAAGWGAVALIMLCRIPQIIKMHREKSVGDFSKASVVLLGAASAMEIILTLWYKFPVQTLCSSTWTFFTFVLFLAQFKLYGAKKA